MINVLPSPKFSSVMIKALLNCFLLLLVLSVKAQRENPFGHALVPDMIADASVQEINGTFYCYATTDGYDQGLKTSGPPVVWKSKDFVHWSFSGSYFPSAVGQKYWAPSKRDAKHEAIRDTLERRRSWAAETYAASSSGAAPCVGSRWSFAILPNVTRRTRSCAAAVRASAPSHWNRL